MRNWLWWTLVSVGCTSGPATEAIDPAPPTSTGGSTSECMCEPLEGSTEWETKVEIGCLCDHFSCTENIEIARAPGSLVRVIEWTCSGKALVVERSFLFSSDVSVFDSTSLRLTGARKYFDSALECGLTVYAGEFPDTERCSACILSHGLSHIAAVGECLDPDTLPDHFLIGGAGGAIGPSDPEMGGAFR